MGNITLKEICVESRKSNYDYIEAQQFTDEPQGRVRTKIEDFNIHGEHVILKLGRKIHDTSNLN